MFFKKESLSFTVSGIYIWKDMISEFTLKRPNWRVWVEGRAWEVFKRSFTVTWVLKCKVEFTRLKRARETLKRASQRENCTDKGTVKYHLYTGQKLEYRWKSKQEPDCKGPCIPIPHKRIFTLFCQR